MSRDGLVDFGKVSFGYAHFLGYERGENKDDPPVVNQEQAATVRDIYRMFMEGKTGYMIAQTLTDNGIPTSAGKPISYTFSFWQKKA